MWFGEGGFPHEDLQESKGLKNIASLIDK